MQEFARKRVGIDAHGWLHKGIFSCSSKICRGIETDAYVEYCMHRVRMLVHFHVTPVLVFDGAELPMKANTHAERKARRDEALEKAEALYASGNFRKAEEMYQRACPVTFEMARNVIRQCRKMNVEYVVAPYEADAQLAWMMASGFIDSVITEDSDLLVYGASHILYKMNKEGQGTLFQGKNLPALNSLCMNHFTEDMFMYMCVCAGCDFFKGVNGLGIRKAHPIVRRHRTLLRIIQAIRMDTKFRVSPTFTVDFTRACLVFRHQTVHDMRTWKTVSLRTLEDAAVSNLPNGVVTRNENGEPDLSFLGRFHDPSIVKRLSEGHIHPQTLKEYDIPLDIVERPMTRKTPTKALPSLRKQLPPPPVKTKEARGFVVQPAIQPSPQQISQSTPSPRAQPLPTAYRPAPNLRQRLNLGSGASRSFDPLLEARRFRSTNSGRVTNPRLAAPVSSVWGKFRPVSQSKGTPSETSRADDSQPVEQEAPKLDAPQTPVDTLQTQVLIEESEDVWDGRLEASQKNFLRTAPDEIETPPLKRPKSVAPSPHKVEAVNRAIAKFAMKRSVDVRLKFCPSEKPPSPDHDSFKLFDEIDDQFSRDAHDGLGDVMKSPVTPAPERRATLGATVRTASASKPKSKKRSRFSDARSQVRVSRFFTPKGNKGDAAEREAENSAAGVKSGIGKGSPSAAVRHAMGGLSKKESSQKVKIDNFRRGAAGKRVDVEDVSR